jgi:hypothetical protein
MVLEALGVKVTVYRADHDPRWEITMSPAPVGELGEASIVFSTGMPSTTVTASSIPRASTAWKAVPGTQTVVAGANGGALTLDMMDQVIDLIRPGRPDALCMSKRTRRKLSSLRRASGNLLETDVDQFGLRALFYDGIPVVVDDFIPDTESQGTASDTSSIYALKLSGRDGVSGLEHGSIQVESVGELETKDASRHRIKW